MDLEVHVTEDPIITEFPDLMVTDLGISIIETSGDNGPTGSWDTQMADVSDAVSIAFQ